MRYKEIFTKNAKKYKTYDFTSTFVFVIGLKSQVKCLKIADCLVISKPVNLSFDLQISAAT